MSTLLLCLISAAAAFSLVIAVRSFREERAWFHPRRGAVERPADLPPELFEVSFRDANGVELRGWQLPARNGAAIAFAHGTGGDRRQLLPEALSLWRAGFGAVVYDQPRHGESQGKMTWGPTEAAALTAAVALLRKSPGVRSVGVCGFSLGSAAAVRAAAADETIGAVALLGPIHDARELTRWEFQRWGPLSYLPAFFADWVETGSFGAPNPQAVELVARWTPRPTLLVWGTRDGTVQRPGVEALLQAVKGPKELLALEGAGHGGYANDPAYLPKLQGFFTRYLLPGALPPPGRWR